MRNGSFPKLNQISQEDKFMSDNPKSTLGTEGVYDAKALGVPKVLLLGLQHMFAMFGATILVPMLTGLDVSTTLLFAGLGTLLFHLLTKGRVPAFLGSSFAYLGGYAAIAPMADAAGNQLDNSALLPYACFGVACSGLLYLLLSLLIKLFGAGKVMRFFPPIVTGPIIIAIGLTLSQSAIDNCATDWLIAVIAIALVIGRLLSSGGRDGTGGFYRRQGSGLGGSADPLE